LRCALLPPPLALAPSLPPLHDALPICSLAPLAEPCALPRCAAAIRRSFAVVRGQKCKFSQCQPAFTRAVSNSGNATVVAVTAAVKHRFGNAGILGALGD